MFLIGLGTGWVTLGGTVYLGFKRVVKRRFTSPGTTGAGTNTDLSQYRVTGEWVGVDQTSVLMEIHAYVREMCDEIRGESV